MLMLLSTQVGTKAPQAAGRIHTDFEKGFIMAEVMKYEDFKEHGSEVAVKVYIWAIIWPGMCYLYMFSVKYFKIYFRLQENTSKKAETTS